METTIKVMNASLMKDYGNSVSNFASSVETAAADTSRSFMTRVEGNYADAINAFFTKLNTLQTQVFEVAPSVLKAYGTSISDFTHAIQEEGFSNVAYTSDAIKEMASELRGKQVDEANAVKAEVKAILEEIVEELGKGNSHIKGFSGAANIYMDTAAKDRETTHNNIVTAHDLMSKKVTSATENLKTLKDIVDNAKVIVSITPQEIISSIKHGGLTAETMYYLDAVQTDEDVKAIKYLMSEGSYKDLLNDGSGRNPEGLEYEEKQKIFKALGRLKGKKMSVGTMEVIVSRFEKEVINSENGVYGGRLPHIEAFFLGMAEQKHSDIQEYTSRLSIASGMIAKGLRGKASAYVLDFSAGSGLTAQEYLNTLASGQGEIMQIDNRLQRLAKINNLFKFVYSSKVGSTEYSATYVGSGYEKESVRAISNTYLANLRLNALGEIELSTYWDRRKTGDYNLQELYTYDSEKTKLLQAEIDDFEEKKNRIIIEDGYNIAKSALSLYSPQAGALLSVIEGGIKLTSSDLEGGLKNSLKVGEGVSEIDEGKGYAKANRTIKLGQSIVDAYFKAEEYDKKILQLQKEQSYLFHDTGGRATNEKLVGGGNPKVINAAFDSTYDLSSHLQQVDFEMNGMRGAIAREAYDGTAASVETAIKKVNQFETEMSETKLVSGQMKELLAGSGGNVTLTDVGVNNVQDVLSNLAKGAKKDSILSTSANDFTKTNAVSFNKYTDGRQNYKMVE